MELIDQLEPTKRGLYGGACGYLSYAGDMDVAIAIRTGIIKNGTLYVQAAAGVVADSVPELEWKETNTRPAHCCVRPSWWSRASNDPRNRQSQTLQHDAGGAP